MDIPNIDTLQNGRMSSNYIKKNFPEFWTFVNDSFPDELSFSEKLYWYYNDITERPVCKICGRHTKYINIHKGYSVYCSAKCSNSDPDKKRKIQKTNIERYGGVAPACSKDVQDKIKEVWTEHYGVDNPMKDDAVKERAKNTCMERYRGQGNASDDIREKYVKSCLEHYGVDNPMKDDAVSENNKVHREKTMMKRYGVRSAFSSETVRKKIYDTIQERYGVPYASMIPGVNNYTNDSGPNKHFADLLDQHGIEYQREFPLDRYMYDFKVGDVLVEVDPYATHNSTWSIRGAQPKDRKYHLNKTHAAAKKGYRCVHLWDWDDPCKIIYTLHSGRSIGARECMIREVDKKTADDFLNDYHLQGTCKGQSVRLGLYYNDELVELMTFGKPRYNKHYQWELLRLCVHPDYNIIGGSQRLFKHFGHDSVISYCDNSKFDGGVYERLGFKLIRKNIPSRHWYDGKVHITDNLLRQKGFDQLFNTHYGKNTSNEELMLRHGFVEIWDCGQSTYEYIKKEDLI